MTTNRTRRKVKWGKRRGKREKRQSRNCLSLVLFLLFFFSASPFDSSAELHSLAIKKFLFLFRHQIAKQETKCFYHSRSIDYQLLLDFYSRSISNDGQVFSTIRRKTDVVKDRWISMIIREASLSALSIMISNYGKAKSLKKINGSNLLGEQKKFRSRFFLLLLSFDLFECLVKVNGYGNNLELMIIDSLRKISKRKRDSLIFICWTLDVRNGSTHRVFFLSMSLCFSSFLFGKSFEIAFLSYKPIRSGNHVWKQKISLKKHTSTVPN